MFRNEIYLNKFNKKKIKNETIPPNIIHLK